MARLNWEKAARKDMVRKAGPPPKPPKSQTKIRARFDGFCVSCGARIKKGTPVWFHHASKKVQHVRCPR
jgi:hypothetical protein